MHSSSTNRGMKDRKGASRKSQESSSYVVGFLTFFRVKSFALFTLMLLTLSVIASAQTESVVYGFANPPDAFGPKCNLVIDTAGIMYGVTFSGGSHNLGAVL